MSQIFNPMIVTKKPSRNKFNLSYYSRLTSRIGDLVPVLCKKVVPSDRFRISISSITRLMPLATPVYDRLRIDYDAFFVQNRILDKEWKEFISGGNGLAGEEDTEGMKEPYFTLSSISGDLRTIFGAGSLFDYLGFQFNDYGTDGNPSSYPNVIQCNALPILGYYKIYDDWYRNERYDTSMISLLQSWYIESSRQYLTSTSWSSLKLCKRRYGKDLYTTALTEPVVGGPVTVPMDGSVAVQYSNTSGQPGLVEPFTDVLATNSASGSLSLSTSAGPNSGRLVADLKNAVGATIQQLNFAYKAFSFFMKDTYNGNRYVEFIESHYGVRVPDATLERPIFLGRHTQWINFSEIFQTSGTTDVEATSGFNTLGGYSGRGAATGTGRLFDKEFDEHGYIYIIMSIRPNSTYFQGVDRKFFYGDRFDSYYFPEFQNIGDMPYYTVELYNDTVTGTSSFDWNKVVSGTVFGYNRENAEYLWYHDEMHGNFLMDEQMYGWTFARKFDTAPQLGSTFVEVPNDINNPFTYRSDEAQNYLTDIMFDIQALRPFVRYESF